MSKIFLSSDYFVQFSMISCRMSIKHDQPVNSEKGGRKLYVRPIPRRAPLTEYVCSRRKNGSPFFQKFNGYSKNFKNFQGFSIFNGLVNGFQCLHNEKILMLFLKNCTMTNRKFHSKQDFLDTYNVMQKYLPSLFCVISSSTISQRCLFLSSCIQLWVTLN